MNIQNILADLGIQDQNHGVMIGAETFGSGASIDSRSPVDGKRIASLSTASNDDYERVMTAATGAFVEWRKWTAPQRGEVVRQYGDALRAKKDSLGALVETLAPKHGGATHSRSLPADLVDVIWSFAVDEDSKDSLLAQEAERSPRPWHSRPPW